ncbi:MAG: DUF2851 family protein [Candidatus Kapabacteria bacterium]|nr:DUF2851 family protein [Candidatus Kapabacteria bacterium]
MERANFNIRELELQKEIHLYISEPSRIFKTVSDRRLQIISPGRLNVHEGPDFEDIAILLDGYLIIGAAEFHKKSSDWLSHSHSDDFRYKDVILHIVLDNDKTIQSSFETLVLNYPEVTKSNNIKASTDFDTTFSSDELQNLALHRLLRKTSEAKKILLENNLKITLSQMTGNYIDRYERKRNRHKYNAERLAGLVEGITTSYAYEFLSNLENGKSAGLQDSMVTLVKKPLAGEGSHLRRELILNAILPIALAIADDEARISLFVWYWSTPCLNIYGLLTRKFPDIPQNFLWQQQGMLEYIKQFGSQNNVASEVLKEYGFAEILSFYRLGRLPLELENSE